MLNTRKSLLMTLVLVLIFGAFAVSAQDDATPIGYGDSVAGSLTADAGDSFYSFEATAGDFVDISLTADDNSFDTYMFLLDATGEEVESNDDGGDRLNSRILGFEIPADGTYTIRATSFSYRDSTGTPVAGDFTLSLNSMILTPLEMNSSVVATLDSDVDSLYFSFDGTEGDVIDLIVDSDGTLDTKMTVIGPFGFRDNDNEDSAESVDPALFEYALSYTGTYLVVVEPQNPLASLQGDLTVILATAELMSLDGGEMVIQLGDNNDTNVFTFDGVAGETIALTMNVIASESYGSPTIEALQGEETIAAARNLNGVTSITFSFVVPVDGAVNVSVSGFGDFEATLLMERMAEEE